MKLLITGGCGFLGSNLAMHALSRGDDLVLFDNLSRTGSVENLAWLKESGNFLFWHGDVRNTNDVTRIIKGIQPDCIFHVAGQVAMTTSLADPRRDFEINTLGTLNILEAARAYAPNAVIIYSSTNKIYGDLEQFAYTETPTRYICRERPLGFDETTPLNFQSPYGCSKGAADQYMLDYSRMFDLRTIVLRHSSMYGERQFATYDQGWIGWFCRQALLAQSGRAGRQTISGNGKQVRDVLHADDMVALYYTLAELPENVAGEAYNVGCGMSNSLSLLELFNFFKTELGVGLEYEMLPPRHSDQKIFVANLSKLTGSVTWAPKIGYVEGIRRMLDWTASYSR